MKSRLEVYEIRNKTRLHTMADYRAALEKADSNPDGLTDVDVLLVEHFGSAAEVELVKAARVGTAQQPSSQPVTESAGKYTESRLKRLFGLIGRAFSEEVTPALKRHEGYATRLEQLEAAVKALQDLPRIGVEYAGVYAQGQTYQRGQLVTRSGGLWLALVDTQLTPGANPTAWKLIVKEGRA